MSILKSFTIKSLKKNRKRTIVTIIAIIITAAMLTGVATIAVSFQDLFVRQAINDYGNFHIKYENVPEDKIDYLLNHDLVENGFTSKLIGHAKIDLASKGESTIQITGYDESAFKEQPIEIIKGVLPTNSSEIVIEEGLSDLANIEIGSELNLDIGLRNFDHEKNEVAISDSKGHLFEVVGIIKRASYEAINYTDYISLTY